MSNYIGLLIVLALAVWLSIRTKKLTNAGAFTGGLLAGLIYLGAGYGGIVLLGTFFLLGTLATSWQISEKQKNFMAEKNKGRRNAAQVIANGGVAGILGLLACFFPEKASIYQLMLAASLAAATADTLSSELGMLYGRKFYNMLTLKKDHKGLDGVVSVEGTLFGIAGSTVIALLYTVFFGWDIAVVWIIVAGTVGNIADSFLGATLERKGYINNDVVNFCNTTAGALSAGLLYMVFAGR